MTELNLPAAEAEIDWPALDLQGRDAAAGRDEAVAAVVASIRDIPGLPVGDHPGRYAAIHDALDAALNEKTPDSPDAATDSAPRPGGR